MKLTFAIIALSFHLPAFAADGGHAIDHPDKRAPVLKTYHVAPYGDDAGPGTGDKPFASIRRARDVVRKFKKGNRKGNITVWLHGGEYRLKETLVFGMDDSGSEGQTITYAAWPGETPVLSGSLPVLGWKPLKKPPADLPEAARGKVWVADVSGFRALKERQKPSPGVASQMDRVERFFTLYQGSRRLPRAHGGKFLMQKNGKRDPAISGNSHSPVMEGRIENWPDAGEAEIALIPDRSWISNILPIKAVDMDTGRVTTAVPGTYNLARTRTHVEVPNTRIENVLALLDEPGEWMVDRRTNTLYLWPPADKSRADLEIPVLTELIRVEGKTDYAGPQDTPVHNLVFRGLTLVHGDRFPWHGMTGWGVQHDWERFDSPTAMMRLRGAENCAVEDCRFLNAGSSGLRLDLHARKNRIVGNRFDDLGGTGILLCGYGPGTKDVNRENTVENNHISRIGRLYHGSPALFAWQSGENRIANNLIHDAPYIGIAVTGRISWSRPGAAQCSRTIRWDDVKKDGWSPGKRPGSWKQREQYLHARNNLVLRNDIHDVMQICGDGNCIYISGAGGGNHILENYCHDCPSRHMNSAIRCDDDQNETIIERNIIHRTGGDAEALMIKGVNTIRENILVDLRTNSGRHRGMLRFFSGDVHGSIIERNVFYSRDPKQRPTYDGSPRKDQPAARLRDTRADHNLYFCEGDPEWGERHLREARKHGIEKHSISDDPMFTDIDHGDLRFLPGSPALQLGIRQPVDVKNTGPRGIHLSKKRNPEKK